VLGNSYAVSAWHVRNNDAPFGRSSKIKTVSAAPVLMDEPQPRRAI
jgi:hypothetical protein